MYTHHLVSSVREGILVFRMPQLGICNTVALWNSSCTKINREFESSQNTGSLCAFGYETCWGFKCHGEKNSRRGFTCPFQKTDQQATSALESNVTLYTPTRLFHRLLGTLKTWSFFMTDSQEINLRFLKVHSWTYSIHIAHDISFTSYSQIFSSTLSMFTITV